ncbi:hypothetical protein EV683_12122 [Crenobacter luteus]|uniref:hypothetical protein n=1 Tax=Crenobacter luteus TaxID=1452487 RepID=UPI001047F644|nr:hypothetical protein [Crenobacter luteus]TCP10622.1 hypothetical protein EV683_12122 [Crenobacter luteus]
MLNPELSAQQFLLLFTAVASLIAGYLLHARLLPWLRSLLRAKHGRLRHFEIHPYQNRATARHDKCSGAPQRKP